MINQSSTRLVVESSQYLQGYRTGEQLQANQESQSKLQFNFGNLGETNDNLRMWAINEIVQVFDKEMQRSFVEIEELPSEVNEDDAQVDDEAESAVDRYREVA